MGLKDSKCLEVGFQLRAYWKLETSVWLETLRSDVRKSAVVLATELVNH